jgi:16S rRNA (uracil1498-N3)-methyltransferase
MSRFYCENFDTGTVELSGEEARHLLSVMRLTAGSTVELFDGKGKLATAVVTSTGRKSAQLKVETIETFLPPTTGRIIIGASVPKGQRLDWMISKCTEIGVDAIAPIICDRTVKLAKGANAADRCKKLSLSATKQCKRIFLPIIGQPQKLAAAIDKLKQTYPAAKIIYGGFSQNPSSILDQVETGKDIIAIVGPEGGFTQDEEKMLKEKGATAVKLTQTILRTETAAITMAAILCTARDNK